MATRPSRRAAAKPAPVTIGAATSPHWAALLPAPGEQEVAAAHWQRIASEMNEREILSASNGHAIQRLVVAYLIYDRCSLAVALDGLVTEPAGDNPKAIARLSIHYKATRYGQRTLAATMDGKFEAVPASLAQRGDIVMAGGLLGICLGGVQAAVGREGDREGLVPIPRASWADPRAWRVQYGF